MPVSRASSKKPNGKRSGNTQLGRLKTRLREAEETLQAIQSGAIDGLVINSASGSSVYTLKGADHAYRVIVENMQEGAATLTPSGSFIYCNRRFAELLGAPLERIVGHDVAEFLLIDRAGELVSRAGAETVFVEAELRAADGCRVPVHLALSPLPAEDGPGLCVVATDLSETKRRDEESALLHTLASAVTEADDLDAALSRALEMICRGTGCQVGEVWAPVPRTGVLTLRGSWAADAKFEEFLETGRRWKFKQPARVVAWKLRAPVWFEDVLEEPNFSRPDEARRAGLHSAVSIPLLERDEPTAVFNLFMTDRRERNPRLMNLVAACASQVSSALQRKQAELRLRESLEEKEVLLREVHHRVKNNLQLISSLLNMQARGIEDPLHREMLQVSRDRVQSIALVHERLYRSKDLGRIELGRYLTELASGLVGAYGAGGAVQVRVVSEVVELSVDVAIPCALIVNELVSNALKHAFPDERRGEVVVELVRAGGVVRISVRDDGVGLGIDFAEQETRSLGLVLVRTLCEELRGELSLSSDAGTIFTVTFPHRIEEG